MTYYIEESPSNRAQCRGCHHNIEMGELRIAHPQTSGWGHRYYHFFCSVCAPKIIKKEIKELDKIMTQLIAFNERYGDIYVQKRPNLID